jgi:hypothetical protein
VVPPLIIPSTAPRASAVPISTSPFCSIFEGTSTGLALSLSLSDLAQLGGQGGGSEDPDIDSQKSVVSECIYNTKSLYRGLL